jgi:predicted enzyme related to lactoylglutathione lyase
MKRVTGIGGIFFKAQDPKALAAWYQRHLGFDVQSWGGTVFQTQPDSLSESAGTHWSPFAADTNYFAPSQASFMVNYRVEDLARLLEVLKAEGVNVDEKVESSEFGHFGWIFDPEGNKIELWQPPQP